MIQRPVSPMQARAAQQALLELLRLAGGNEELAVLSVQCAMNENKTCDPKKAAEFVLAIRETRALVEGVLIPEWEEQQREADEHHD